MGVGKGGGYGGFVPLRDGVEAEAEVPFFDFRLGGYLAGGAGEVGGGDGFVVWLIGVVERRGGG